MWAGAVARGGGAGAGAGAGGCCCWRCAAITVSAVEAGVGVGRSGGRTTVGSVRGAAWSVQRMPSHQLFLPVPSEYHPGALPGGGGGGLLMCSDPISETR